MNNSTHWRLNSKIDYLNHGSFGAAPNVVLRAQRELQDVLERDPIRFLAPERELLPKLDEVRRQIAELVGAPQQDIALVRNATDGVNAVLRSLSIASGDELVCTDHGYNACNNALQFVAERSGATVRVAKVPFPISTSDEVVEAIEAEFSDRTRLLLVDHVTSPTGLVFPLQKIIQVAHARGIRVLVDGAHAPGMLPLDLRTLDPDYYTANHHKWLCGPKASGFLYVRREFQPEVRPTVISHGANRQHSDRSRFLTEFDWVGTYDATVILAVPTAIEFLSSLFPTGLNGLMAENHDLALRSRDVLCNALQIAPPSPPEMIGSMVSIPLSIAGGSSGDESETLQARLYAEHRIEVPVFSWAPSGAPAGTRLLRVSLQAYNNIQQVERLARILGSINR